MTKRFSYDYKTGRLYDNESDWQGTSNPLHWVRRLNELAEENEHLKQRLDEVLSELYCKDRKLEELGVSVECCDKR